MIVADASGSTAEALATRGSTIVATGTRAEIEQFASPATRVIDLGGGAVLPGINDSHLHGSMLGAAWPGIWTDELVDGAVLPPPRALSTEADRRAALRQAWDVLLPLGITSYTEPGLGPGADDQYGGSCGAAVLDTYAALALAGELPLRVTALLLFGELEGPSHPEGLARGIREIALPQTDPRRFRVAGVKLFADGIPPMRTAWVEQPYLDGSGGSLVVSGTSDDDRVSSLRAMIGIAHQAGYQVGVHATGTRTVRAVAECFAAQQDASRRRHYVIHGDSAASETLRQMAGAGVGLTTQPRLFTRTAGLLDAVWGSARTDAAFPIRSALAAGVRVTLSSDGPVVTPDWREGVAAAVLRSADDGSVRGAAERITMLEAIRAYTAAPAWQDHAETWKGTLEAGKVADLCILAHNPFHLAPEELPGVDVAMTVVDGAVVFERA